MKFFNTLRENRRLRCGAVIVAAGASTRMQGTDKIMADLCGTPVIVHTLRAFEQSPEIDEIVLVTRPELRAELTSVTAREGFGKVTAVVPGGNTRMESVNRGLTALSKNIRLAAIQDGARPLVTGEIISAAVTKARTTSAAAPAIPVKDTVKVADSEGRVLSTPDRETLRAVQTPQVFDRDLLLAAWKKAEQEGKQYTDDCAAMEGLGKTVYLTEGSEENLKITTPLDLILAEEILKRRKTP